MAQVLFQAARTGYVTLLLRFARGNGSQVVFVVYEFASGHMEYFCVCGSQDFQVWRDSASGLRMFRPESGSTDRR